MKKLQALVFAAAALLAAASHADVAAEAPLSVAQLSANPKASDGKVIQLQGFYLADLMRVPHLYASKKDALADKEYDAIDLIFADTLLKASLKDSAPACVVVKGAFSTYDHGHILIGLLSKYGVLRVQSVEPCSA